MTEFAWSSKRFCCKLRSVRFLPATEKFRIHLPELFNVRRVAGHGLPCRQIANYIVFKGLVKYGYTLEARELVMETIRLFGKDFQESGALHEYYEPESGEPLLNKGFQKWHYLVINMIAWFEGKPVVEEF